jgi:hypothetical protein
MACMTLQLEIQTCPGPQLDHRIAATGATSTAGLSRGLAIIMMMASSSRAKLAAARARARMVAGGLARKAPAAKADLRVGIAAARGPLALSPSGPSPGPVQDSDAVQLGKFVSNLKTVTPLNFQVDPSQWHRVWPCHDAERHSAYQYTDNASLPVSQASGFPSHSNRRRDFFGDFAISYRYIGHAVRLPGDVPEPECLRLDRSRGCRLTAGWKDPD